MDAKNAKMMLGQFIGTDFRHDFQPGNVISLNGHVDIVDRTEQTGAAAGKQLYLTHGIPPAKIPRTGVQPQPDSDLFVPRNWAGMARLGVEKSGHLGLQTVDLGEARLKVQGLLL